MDWANHYLRKAGHSATLSDLKDISDGQFLPQIIQAVGKGERERGGRAERERVPFINTCTFSCFPLVHGEVPGIIATVQSEEDRVSHTPIS